MLKGLFELINSINQPMEQKVIGENCGVSHVYLLSNVGKYEACV